MFITPPDVPEDITCRTLRIPDSLLWSGIFNKALATTIQKWNWVQVNDTHLTPEEAVAAAYAVLTQWFDNLSSCEGCTLPGGERVIRINEDGVYQELTDAGWDVPSGDYELPAIPPRTGGTADDKRCLASANAAYCMKVMYESLTDSFSAGLTVDEAIGALILAVVGLVLAPFSLLLAAILAVAVVAFAICYEIAGFITADYWSSDFDAKLTCALYECSSIDGSNVVTFDFDCFNERLANKIDITSDYFELMLFGQIQAILGWIGGDGLNLMGVTTAITAADCSFCHPHCFYLDLRLSNGSAYGLTLQGGEWVNGVGLRGLTYSGSVHAVWGYVSFGGVKFVTRVQAIYTKTNGAGATNVWYARGLYPTATGYATVQAALDPFFSLGTNLTKNSDFVMDLAGYGFDINAGTATQQPILQSLRFEYYGTIPSGWSDNCPP